MRGNRGTRRTQIPYVETTSIRRRLAEREAGPCNQVKKRQKTNVSKCVYVCMYVCMYICMYICMYVCNGRELHRGAESAIYRRRKNKTRGASTVRETCCSSKSLFTGLENVYMHAREHDHLDNSCSLLAGIPLTALTMARHVLL